MFLNQFHHAFNLNLPLGGDDFSPRTFHLNIAFPIQFIILHNSFFQLNYHRLKPVGSLADWKSAKEPGYKPEATVKLKLSAKAEGMYPVVEKINRQTIFNQTAVYNKFRDKYKFYLRIIHG